MALAAIVLFVSQLFFPYALSSYFFALNGHLKDPDIVVVALDDATINSASFKRYQDISRCDYATLLKNLLNSEPKAIGVDVFFSSASKDAGCDDELSGLLQKNPNIFVGSEYNEKTKEIIPLFNGKKNLETIGLVNIHGYHLAGAFAEEFLGIAHKTDTRNSLLLYSFGKNINVLPISLSLYQYAMGIPSVDISQNEVAFAGKNAFPHSDGRLFINFFSSNYPEISFIDVISNRFDPEFFRGKTVFVGATSHDIHDEFYTPYDTRNFMPGVVIHANAYNSLTAQKPILPIPFWMQMLL
jgi:CHASE2 domain-containing sensor protein